MAQQTHPHSSEVTAPQMPADVDGSLERW